MHRREMNDSGWMLSSVFFYNRTNLIDDNSSSSLTHGAYVTGRAVKTY